MYIFIDESGDCGTKSTSADYFALTAVFVETGGDQVECESLIQSVRTRLGLSASHEFHFRGASHEKRIAFLETLAHGPFWYVASLVVKPTIARFCKDDIFRQSIALIAEDLREPLLIARASKGKPLYVRVTADDNRDKLFFRLLRAELFRHKDDEGRSLIDRIRPGQSATLDMLQLADMICGSLADAHQGNDVYQRILASREMAFRTVELES